MGDQSDVSMALGIIYYYRPDCKLHVMEEKRAGHELFEVELIIKCARKRVDMRLLKWS